MTPMFNPPHPGRLVKNELTGRHISLADAANQIGIDRATLSSVLKEQAGITPEMSRKMADAFDTSPDLWYKMQAAYDEWHASQKAAR